MGFRGFGGVGFRGSILASLFTTVLVLGLLNTTSIIVAIGISMIAIMNSILVLRCIRVYSLLLHPSLLKAAPFQIG